MRLENWRCVRAVVVVYPLLLAGQGNDPAGPFLQSKATVGDVFGDVFSRAIAYKANGYEDVVRRVSGTAIYKVAESGAQGMTLDGRFLYDGRPEDRGRTEIKDRGRTICYNGKCSAATDASGLAYNPRLWGEPTAPLRKGMQWEVTIAEPWELGPAGKQIVTVRFVDQGNHAVELQREGWGEGSFEGDPKQIHLTKENKTYLVDVSPGRAHWTGCTVFREGIVISDELTVERKVALSSKEIGTVEGSEREYILLNAMPVSGF